MHLQRLMTLFPVKTLLTIPLMHASSMFDDIISNKNIIDHSYITAFDALALNGFLP